MSNEPVEEHSDDVGIPASVAHGLIVFTTADCPFCMRVKLLLESLSVEPTYIDALASENVHIYDAVVAETEHTTLPLVLFNGRLIGGCDDTCMAVERGDLQRLLRLPSFNATVPTDVARGVPTPGLFLYPPAVKRWIPKGVAVQIVAISIVIIVFRESQWAWWLCFGMALDFVFRLIAGGTASILGSTALFFTAWLPDELSPGPPKQFAAFCGVFCFGLATILFHAGNGNDTSHVGGSLVVGAVMACAFLETCFNFCPGCFVFGLMVKFGIVRDTVYQPYTDNLGMMTYSLNDQNTKNGWSVDNAAVPSALPGCIPAKDEELLGWRRRAGKNAPTPVPVIVSSVPHPSGFPSAIDVEYKFPKTDDTIREHWSAAYIQFEDFGMVLGIAGFAAALRAVGSPRHVPTAVVEAIAIFAGCIYGAMLLGLTFTLFMHTRKLYKSLQHPFKRNALAALPICNLLFAYLLHDYSDTFEEVLFFTGCVGAALHLILCLACWFKNRHSSEHINPSYVFPAASCLVAAMVSSQIGQLHSGTFARDYTEVGFWFFGAGFLTFVLVLAMSFSHGITYHWSDDRLRPLVGLWMGGCFIAQIAYQAVNQTVAFDTFSFVFFATGVLLFLVNLYLVYPGRWLLRGRFEMANWALAFPLDLGVIAASNYRSYREQLVFGAIDNGTDAFSLSILWVFLIFACLANYTMLFHTLFLLVRRRWPRAPVKWSPLSYNKLQHEAMRNILYTMRLEASLPVAGDAADQRNNTERLLELWSTYEQLLVMHAAYEDDILFPELSALNDSQVHGAEEQHQVLDAQLHGIADVITGWQQQQQQAQQFSSAAAVGPSAAAVLRLKQLVLEHVDCMEDHVQWEEDHLAPLIRKLLNLDIHVEIIKRVWASVPLSEMERSLVTVVRYLSTHDQRARYIKALLWAKPERAQQIGAWLFRGLAFDPLGDAKYAMLVQDLPEIAPRGSGIDWNQHL